MNDENFSVQQARRYIRDLIITKSQLLPKALAHYEKRFGCPFWSKENPSGQKSLLDPFSIENFKK